MRNAWWILLALVLGLTVGALVGALWTPQTWAELGVQDPGAYLAARPSDGNAQAGPAAGAARFVARLNTFIGDAFVRALRMLAVPIVLFTLIAGFATLTEQARAAHAGPDAPPSPSPPAPSPPAPRSPAPTSPADPDDPDDPAARALAARTLRRVGLRTVGLFTVLTVIAVLIGLALAYAVRPGVLTEDQRRAVFAQAAPAPAASAQGAAPSLWNTLLSAIPTNPFDALARGDVLQTVVVAVMVGSVLALLPARRARPVLEVCDVLSEVFIRVITLLMKLAPVPVFCLLAGVAARSGLGVVVSLGVYALTVVAGLTVLCLGLYTPVAALGGVGPGRFLRGMLPAGLLAFSTSSSTATLPVTIRCAHENLGVPKRLAGFVCSLGATINLGGTGLYQAISAVFIAQLYGVDLSAGQLVTLVFAVTVSAIGTPGIPAGGTALFIAVLQTVGLPIEGVAIVLALDRPLDMSRTVANVLGDTATAALVHRWEPTRGS